MNYILKCLSENKVKIFEYICENCIQYSVTAILFSATRIIDVKAVYQEPKIDLAITSEGISESTPAATSRPLKHTN